MVTSKSIHILPGRCVNVQARGLGENEAWTVEYTIDGQNCDVPAPNAYTPYHENGAPVLLDTLHNPLTLWRPGWYRFVLEGEAVDTNATIETGEPFNCGITAPVVYV